MTVVLPTRCLSAEDAPLFNLVQMQRLAEDASDWLGGSLVRPLIGCLLGVRLQIDKQADTVD